MLLVTDRFLATLLAMPSVLGLVVALAATPLRSHAAEEPLTLLTIEGDLIGKIDTLDTNTAPEALIAAYYLLLPEAAHEQVVSRQAQLTKLIPDYEVAFVAADSAEITEVRSDMDTLWAEIRTIHAQYFTPAVTELLEKSYDYLFSKINFQSAGTTN